MAGTARHQVLSQGPLAFAILLGMAGGCALEAATAEMCASLIRFLVLALL